MMLNMLYLLLGLSVIVSLFGVINTLVLSVFERTRELGMLRAIGMTRRQVRRMIRHESIVTALIGAALGIGVGMFLAAVTTTALSKYGVCFAVPFESLAIFVVDRDSRRHAGGDPARPPGLAPERARGVAIRVAPATRRTTTKAPFAGPSSSCSDATPRGMVRLLVVASADRGAARPGGRRGARAGAARRAAGDQEANERSRLRARARSVRLSLRALELCARARSRDADLVPPAARSRRRGRSRSSPRSSPARAHAARRATRSTGTRSGGRTRATSSKRGAVSPGRRARCG